MRDADDDEDDPELEAALKRKPKITRPAFSPGPKTTTEKPEVPVESEKVEQPTAPAAADADRQPVEGSRPPVAADSARSFAGARPLPPLPPPLAQQPPPPRMQSVEQPSRPLFTAFPSSSLASRPYQALPPPPPPPADSAVQAQWGVKGGRTSKGSAFWLGKGSQQQQQQQFPQQAIVKSPIARGKSMYRPRPQVPMVLAPLPMTDLQVVPDAVARQDRVVLQQQQRQFQQPQQQQQQQQQQQWTPQQQQVSSSSGRFEEEEDGQVNQAFRPSQPAPAQVVPIARGSRPRSFTSSKSKYVDVNDYQQRTEELSLPHPSSSSNQAKPTLARAAVSEQQQPPQGGAFALDDCPYGMRLSMCRLRAAQRLRS